MEVVSITISESELEKLVKRCENYGFDNLNDCVNMALARLLYIYKGL